MISLPTRTSTYVVVGQHAVVRASGMLTTVVSSCVSVCLWCPLPRAGGMNHFLLPSASPTSPGAGGDVATQRLIAALRNIGVPPTRMLAKVFGGAASTESRFHVGAENVRVARTALAQARIPIIASDLGGERGRRLDFDVRTGVVRVSYLVGLALEDVP